MARRKKNQQPTANLPVLTPTVDPRDQRTLVPLPPPIRRRHPSSKLTLELIDELADVIACGNFIETACNVVGISRAAFYQWKAAGEAAISKGDHADIAAIFVDTIRKAEGASEARGLAGMEVLIYGRPEIRDENGAVISRQIEPHPQLLAYWLERRFPQRWAKREAAMQDDEPGKKALTPEQRAARIAELTAKQKD